MFSHLDVDMERLKRLAFPKPEPWFLQHQEKKATRSLLEIKENLKVRLRSGGQCEVIIKGQRCQRRAFTIHHMLSGWGVRGRGASALANHKQHVCDGPRGHHRLITGHVLKIRHTGRTPIYSQSYERVR